MAEKLLVRSAVSKFLVHRKLTVADLVRRMELKGFRFDKKTIYRLASDAPVRNLNLLVIAAIGQVLELSDPGTRVSSGGRIISPCRRIGCTLSDVLPPGEPRWSVCV